VGAGAPRYARVLRVAGTALVVAGVAVLAWVFVVWQWNDPFTGLYTRWQQHRLASSYAHVVADYRPQLVRHAGPGRVTVADEQRAVAAEAQRFRRTVHEGAPIGRISVPRLGLGMVLVNGTDHDSLTKGPGRDPRTFMPGQGQLI
jgi:hypothetical protein